MKDAGSIVQAMRGSSPTLTEAVDALVVEWLVPVIARLGRIDEGTDHSLSSKHLNDPIWHTVELERQEVLLLDSPLVQRMRGVKQLGLANLVFPGANHDRFEHICGVVEGADRMFLALKINAERRGIETTKGHELPLLSDDDRRLVRLAALFHDVGHGPFSHAIEPVVDAQYALEVKAFNRYAANTFFLDSKIAVAEVISILIVLSPTMRRILDHSLFQRPKDCSAPEFQLRIITLIMGARRHAQLACLSAIVSGQVDADKLDYMARDALHSGMPIAFDTERLLRKLEIIRCTADNLPVTKSQDGNRAFAESSAGQCYFDLGIAASGVGSLEQMLIGRAFLYDRLYHHHKVRAADAMAQRLLHFAREERGTAFALRELYTSVSDDTMLRLLGGEISRPGFSGGGPKSARLARAILDRDLYVRSFAFRAIFHTGIPKNADEKARTDALAEIWTPVSTELSDLTGRLAAEKAIIAIAKRIGPQTGDSGLSALAERLDEAHVIVDLADNRIKTVTMNVHAEDGSLEEPNLFFDPSRWSHVYDLQKRTGYVFCPREMVPLVALASKIFFFERWGYAVSVRADRFTKTLVAIKPSWIATLRASGSIDDLTEAVLKREITIRTFLRESDLSFPSEWENEAADLRTELADELRTLVPQGLSAEDKEAVVATMNGLCSFIHTMHQDKTWVTTPNLKEADLQRALARHLRARGLNVDEGGALGGGLFDLVVEKRTLIENKIAGPTNDPFTAKPEAPYQADRYAVAKCMRVFFTMVGFVPAQGSTLPGQTDSIKVRKLDKADRAAAEICVVMPFGAPSPSKVKIAEPPT
jgi:HD superfamily phosphohydrolase